MECRICNHACRAHIENALLNAPTTDTLEKLSAEYDVDIKELQVHALMHAPMGVDADEVDKPSIARQSKMRELDMLLAAANDYMVTLKTVGAKINEEANKNDLVSFSRSISKSVVDLYLGTGGELRQTIKTIADLDAMLNGPKDSAASGLQALAAAIRGSKND